MRVLIQISDPSLAGQVRGLIRLAGIPECAPEDLAAGDLCLLDEAAGAKAYPADVRCVVFAEGAAADTERGSVCTLPLSYRALWDLLRGTGESPRTETEERPAEEAKPSETAPAERQSDPDADPPSADCRTRTVRCGGRETVLTPREFAVFAALVRYAHAHAAEGAVLSRETLLAQAWADVSPKPVSNAADVTVGYVRRKLAPLFGEGAILAKRGRGYVWCGGEVLFRE